MDNGIFNKLLATPYIGSALTQLFQSLSPKQQIAFQNRPEILKALNTDKTTEAIPNLLGTLDMRAIGGIPQLDTTNFDKGEGPGFGNVAALTGAAIKNHPFKAIGLAGLGAGNIGGFMDNNKFGGQLAGLGLGGLGAATLASGNPYMQAMITMGGGELGALFDKLRARKELEEKQGYPNAGNPIAMMNRR